LPIKAKENPMSDSFPYWSSFEFANCPFFDQDESRCKGSISNAPVPGQRQFLYCQSDDHDQCTYYLAKLLRQSRAKSSEPLLRGFCEK
jgi:hypothetical protein